MSKHERMPSLRLSLSINLLTTSTKRPVETSYANLTILPAMLTLWISEALYLNCTRSMCMCSDLLYVLTLSCKVTFYSASPFQLVYGR